MKIICSVCGMEMEYEEQAMSPGSNDPCLVVKPCCVPENIAARIGHLETDEIPEMFDNMTGLIDSIDNFMEMIKGENCYIDSKEQRQEIEDYTTILLNQIKDLQTEDV